jgi:spore coat protein A, manganese oxidase
MGTEPISEGGLHVSVTRRQFIKTTAGAAGALAASGILLKPRAAHAYAVSPPLRKFIDPLQGLGEAGIPVATPNQTKYPGVDYYEIELNVFRQQLHTDLPAGGQRLYGYADVGNGKTANHKHLGGLIVATKGTPVRIKFTNNLPTPHILPFDNSITQGIGVVPTQDRAAIHLHGGLVPWPSDGGPFHWLGSGNSTDSQTGTFGASWVRWLPNDQGFLTNDYYYPNNQSPRLMWYHDHAIGITRTNAYAGVATGYLITDSLDGALPGGIGVPLIFQDKVFWNPAIDPNYSLYVAPGAQAGDLWYPYLYEKQIWKLAAGNNAKKAAMLPVPSAVAEMFGDTMLVNGRAYPYMNVNPDTYRFRMLNACNARFLNLSFVMEDPVVPGEPWIGPNKLPVPAPVNVWQIGTEGGFLPTAVPLFINGSPTFLSPLLVGPAERPDVYVDFSACGSSKVLLYNDAPAPYPGGSAMFDYFLGVKGVLAGSGPNTRTLMRFNVAAGVGTPFTPPSIPANPTLPTVPDLVNGGLNLALSPGGTYSHNGATYTVATTTQELTLNEAFDLSGRLMQLVGTSVPLVAGAGFGRAYLDTPTEFVKYKTIQIWNIYNLTADAHPMHFHLFNVMVLRRRPFRVNQFNGIPIFTAPGIGPDLTETGWKETVKMYPGTCTTVAVLVEEPLPNRTVNVSTSNGLASGTVPSSPRLATAGITGDEYVWHCHILEHEEHDMMRPLVGQ